MRLSIALLVATRVAAQDIQLQAEPKVIAPGVVSTPAEEFKATVSPDGADASRRGVFGEMA